MRESELEAIFVKRVKKAGGRAYKFTSPGRRGMPDRIALFPGGRVFMVELKTPEGRLSIHQRGVIAEFARLGTPVAVLRTVAEIDAWITDKELP